MKPWLSLLIFIAFSPSVDALTPTRQQVLDYLGKLSDSSYNGVIIGQNCGDAISCVRPVDGQPNVTYDHVFTDFAGLSGKYPGLVDVVYEYLGPYSNDQILSENGGVNAILMEHWGKGGLVSITWTPRNPFDDRSNLTHHPDGSVTERWEDPVLFTGDEGLCDPDHSNTFRANCEKTPGTNINPPPENLNWLTTSDNAHYTNWHRKLDKLAVGLKELMDAGVVVLFRPMQEHNGSWFWYAKKPNEIEKQIYNPEPFVKLWQDMHQYLTVNKGLNNLIWVWAPAGGQNGSKFYYPGDDYVDVVAGTAYSGDQNNPQRLLDLSEGEGSDFYADWTAYGKPVGISEYNFDFESEYAKYKDSFDLTIYAKKVREKYPKIAFFVPWHSWGSGADRRWMSLMDHANNAAAPQAALELMNDPNSISRDKINAAVLLPDSTPIYPVNLIPNPSFEQGELSPWLIHGNSSISVVNNSDNAHTGLWSAVVDPDSGSTTHRFPAAPDTNYTLSAWGKVTQSQWAAIGYRFYDEKGSVINTIDPTYLLPFGKTYMKQSADFKAPAGVASIEISVWNSAGGHLYIDDVELTAALGK